MGTWLPAGGPSGSWFGLSRPSGAQAVSPQQPRKIQQFQEISKSGSQKYCRSFGKIQLTMFEKYRNRRSDSDFCQGRGGGEETGGIATFYPLDRRINFWFLCFDREGPPERPDSWWHCLDQLCICGVNNNHTSDAFRLCSNKLPGEGVQENGKIEKYNRG